MNKSNENDTINQADFIREADEANGIQIVNGIDGGQLLNYIERIELLEERKKALAADIENVFDEAKRAKFDVKAMKEILKRRKSDEHEVAELDFAIEVYKRALGMA